MSRVKNILFIMCDQLRADYLACTGHPTLKTPNIDALAARGVIFTNAFCQAPVCGSSRMSFYTGRYVQSHGATYNNVPLKIGERTVGDHMRELGVSTGLIGKTHMQADLAGMKRLGIDKGSIQGVLAAECGFEPWERDDGLHPDAFVDPNLAYNDYLREQGYEGDNPWHSFANSGIDEKGEVASGWYLRNAHLAARIDKAHSETAYMTNRAMDKIAELGDTPWCLHLSYIKPHWPYIAPAPYHNMYSPQDVIAANRGEKEKADPHPVIKAFMGHEESVNFSDEEKRRHVIPAYMGLITEIDDHIGRLMAFLEEQGRLDDTLIVFTSDHGDYLGDHWLGEKEMFHEESVRIPMIIVDPSRDCDATRGGRIHALTEAIDLIPTFVDALGGEAKPHVLEGKSLLPLLRGENPAGWRDFAVSEADYAWRGARLALKLPPDQTRAYMIRTERWKYISYDQFRPQLFDLEKDPNELIDLGTSELHAEIRNEMEETLNHWLRHRRNRTTMAHDVIEERTDTAKKRGIYFGVW
ncbi:sulfatase-like hydrolase/transferase [Sneathiella chungangensis]|uniref:Sulfatase-like hydrolase/transferase n=1 Tax=Sneathiella chungangensis TaxID=1418234 RepID=A0A845M9F9_9PROT|nr:alkaline phosphatase family protein [Sneathiella chungangensis]MZR20751.1 sulfatase-like hydrolase/transferase [Sneathiella chungangensis]